MISLSSDTRILDVRSDTLQTARRFRELREDSKCSDPHGHEFRSICWSVIRMIKSVMIRSSGVCHPQKKFLRSRNFAITILLGELPVGHANGRFQFQVWPCTPSSLFAHFFGLSQLVKSYCTRKKQVSWVLNRACLLLLSNCRQIRLECGRAHMLPLSPA